MNSWVSENDVHIHTHIPSCLFQEIQSRLTFYFRDIVVAMSPLDTVVSESTESIQVVVVWPVVNIITEPTLTSTILVTS